MTGQQLDDPLAHLREVGTQADQYLRPDALAFPDQAQEHVLRTNVVVPELESFTQGEL